jgi:restriction system protein
MSRHRRRETRKAKGLAELGIKLLALGAAFALAPLFLSGSPLGKALGALTPLGLLLLVVGGLITWLSRRSGEPQALKTGNRLGTSTRSEPTERSSPPSPPLDPEHTSVVARTPVTSAPDRPTAWGTEVFDAIEWRRFEALVEALFRQGGFETRSQSHGADGGVDIWLHSRHAPGPPVSIVQCKHWQAGKRVGVDKIRELRGVMAAHNVSRGQFATTSTFTPDAVAFARDNGVNLLDVSGLLALVAKRSAERQQELLEVALEGEYWRPTCVNCGIKMSNKTPRKGGTPFWGCSNYPRCRTTMQMRAR